MSGIRELAFRQVDVFTDRPHLGNPVAVVHEADGLSDAEMARFARWTNLSETTFLVSPTDPAADYRVRIFTTTGELPFAGHPTLGSAHAWLAAGGRPAGPERVVQECGAGLVAVRHDAERWAFEAPPLLRAGDVDAETSRAVVAALAVPDSAVVGMTWADNGPGWIAVEVDDADRVLGIEPDLSAFADLSVGVVGRYRADQAAQVGAQVEVRAFYPGHGLVEDPVTGSLNAGIGQWLAGDRLPLSYVASQGTRLGRRGRVHVDREGDQVWVGGDAITCVSGTVRF